MALRNDADGLQWPVTATLRAHFSTTTMRILVAGGAGYIGSHMVKFLRLRGHDIWVVDNLSTGHRDAVGDVPLVELDLRDHTQIHQLLAEARFEAVMHFADLSRVGESVADPASYYGNNLGGAVSLLHAMQRTGTRFLIYSSSAAVYGTPSSVPIREDAPFAPLSPYGVSKATVEGILGDYDRAHGLRAVRLRYFNAAGADPDGDLGERHEPESHLIPIVLHAANGRRNSVSLFGTDYATPDGTCVRDYVHVWDLCDAHIRALEYAVDNDRSGAFNLGSERGFSVREVIETARRLTGREIAVIDCPRRAGDPPRLIADSTRARSVLGWKPAYSDLDTIIEHAWRWERR